MAQEATPANEPAEGQAPEGASGQEPQEESTPAKTFDEAYVKGLRKEAAAARTEAASLKAELAKRDEADKSELERATERATESERRAVESEAKLMRFEVAAAHGFDARLAAALKGDTREEIEESADVIAEALQAQTSQPRMPSLDGGARKTPDEKKSPEAEHADFLLGVLGKGRQQ